jgi:hypothetical protein
LPNTGAPRIVYIGQSFRTIKRLQSHSRVNQASSLLNDDEELRLNLVAYRTTYVGGRFMDRLWNEFLVDGPDRSGFKQKTSLIERMLIAFYNPILNVRHRFVKLDKDPLVISLRRRRGLRGVGLGVGMYGPLGQFWSPDQVFQEEIVSFDFEQAQNGFVPGLAAVLN